MNILDRFRSALSSRSPPSSGHLSNVAQAAASSVRARLLRSPDGRVSRDPNDFAGLLSAYQETLAGYPGNSRARIIAVLRGLAESDDDVGGALGDLQALCGAGFSLDFLGGKRAITLAEAELEQWGGRIFPEGGGLPGLILNQVAELALAGASSLEWYPEKSRQGVAGVAVIPAEEIRISRDSASQALVFEQLALGGMITLNPRTYLYAAPRTTSRQPYGLPLFVASLFSLDRKRQLLGAEQRVINLMARSALVKATIPTPKPRELGLVSEQDPRYADAVTAFFDTVVDSIVSSSESGVYVAPDKTDITVIGINQTATGANEITKANQKRVWNSLRTLPFMRGEMDSTTQALAQVTLPILHAQVISLQQTLKRQLEFGLNLHLSLRGIPAQAFVNFTKPASPFLLDEARAELARAQTDTALATLFGPAWAAQAMRRWDIAEGDAARAPAWWKPGSPTPTPIPDDGGTP